MKDEIEKAMKHFAGIQGIKRAFLLTQAGAYFLYDNKFCSISDYQVRLQSRQYSLNGVQVEQPLFVGMVKEQVACAALPSYPLEIDVMRLVFHIRCGPELEESLGGIFFARNADACLALFSNPAVEKVFLAAEAEWICRMPPVMPGPELADLQQSFCGDDLRMLTELYIKGQPWDAAKSMKNILC